MGVQRNISTSCTSESSPSLSNKKKILDKYRRARPAYSSSSSSPQVSKEKTASEKLFARECKELQKNFNESLDSNVLSSNASDTLEPRLQNGRDFDFNYPDEDIKVHTEGVLHFKKPLINKKNEAIFYESRGRMEPMDWSVINDNKKTEHTKNKLDIPRSKTEKVIKINEYSKCIPEVNPEFLNFEQNSHKSEKTYEVRNNFEKIPNMNLPISILQRKIKSRPNDSLPVTPKIREAFKCLQSDVHLTDLIDRPIDEPTALSSKQSNLHKVPITAGDYDMSISKQSEYNLNESKNLCEFGSHDSLSTLGVQNLTDGDRKRSVDEQEDKIFNIEKSSSKSRGLDEYDDEMFNFPKSSSKPKSDSNNSALKAVSPRKEVHSVNNGLVTLSNSESPSPRAQLYFNKIKNIQAEKLNYSLDSDDLSLGAPTRQNDDSISKKSMTFNYEIFKNKLKNTSTQYSPVRNETRENEEKIKQKDSENVDDKFQTKQVRTREFIMSNSNAFTEETNAVEISNIKIFPKAEPLLTAVSTRYFTKSLNKEEDVDTQIKDTNKVTKKVATIDFLDTYTANKSTTVNPNSFLCDNESDSSQDLYLSFDNTSNDDVSVVMTKSNEENRIQSFNRHVTSTDIESQYDAASDKTEEDSHSIFYSCKYDDDTKTSVVIEEIDNSETLGNKNPIISNSNATTDDIAALYKDMIESDEEFDIVNVDRFPTYASIFNKLMEVKEAQKAIATGVLDVDDPEFVNKVQAYTRYKNDDRAIAFDKSKCTESSLEISDNHYSSVDASVSSNVESDCKASGSSNSLFNAKDNIFGNLKIDNSLLDNSILSYYGNKPEPKKLNTLPNKNGMSNHTKKIKGALNKYRKYMKPEVTENLRPNITEEVKPKVIEDVKKEEIEKSVQVQPNTIPNSKRLQLLNEMKKRKAQLADNKR